jgi:hypothetical protein
MLPCMFGGTTDWRQELLGCAPVCDPRTKEHAQPCPFRKFHPERGTSAMSENRGIMLCDDARPPVRARNIRLRSVQVAAPTLRRALPRRRLRGSDRALLVWMVRLFDLAQVVKPETILRWHRAGFRAFWRWKSRNRVGRPNIDRDLRDLIQRMSRENPLWGAPRIHGELLMLGFNVAQSTVSKYMARGHKPPSQCWKTFLLNHADAIASIDMCVVPTVRFERLFAVLILGHSRRQLLWFEVTRHPTAAWLAPSDHGSLSLGISANLSDTR